MEDKDRFQALHFEMTNQCNLRCKHCYNIDYLNSNEKELSTEEVKKIIDKSIELGAKDIGFSGGEPFMRKDIFELIEYAKDYPIHVLTNGLLLDEKAIKKLNKIKDLVIEFRISLDGLKTHKMLRNVSYEKVLDHIKLLLENDYVVTVNTMVTDFNIDELFEMYEIFKKIKVDRWRLDFVFDSGNAANNGFKYGNKKYMLNNLKELIRKYIIERPDFIFDVNKLFRSSLLEGHNAISYTLDTKPCYYQGSLCVRPNGEVSFCPSLNITYGNILKEDIEDIVKKKEWKEFSNIKVKDLPKKCIECKYMKYCGGGCRADAYYESGSIYGINDMTCELVEFYVEEIIPMVNELINKKDLK